MDLHLTGDEENPAHTTPMSVLARLTLNGLDLTYSLTVSGVDISQVTMAHIHRGAPGVNGPVIYPLSDKGFITTAGKVTLTPDDLADLLRGNLYVNVHSPTYPNGDVRAQILPPRIAMLYQQQADAYNRGDLNGLLGFFDDNAVVAHPPLCFPAPCRGKAALQQDEQVEIGSHSHLQVLAISAAGSQLSVLEEVKADAISALGFSRIHTLDDVTYAGDKIAAVSSAPDFSDGQTAAYISTPQPSFTPPNTGDAGLLTSLSESGDAEILEVRRIPTLTAF